MLREVRIVDLFAGIGGLRLGAVNALKALGYDPKIVFTSEIKKPAVETLLLNYPGEQISGDITKIDTETIPPHDLLLAGFPCQAFSYAGNRKGFEDKTRGTLFFDVLRILKHHKPSKFVLENVEGLVTHDKDPETPNSESGRTLNTILEELALVGYQVSWGVLDATDFGVPQARRRVFITGSLSPSNAVSEAETRRSAPLSSILEKTSQIGSQDALESFNSLLVEHYGEDLSVLEGKIFRDWRGGERNIHSWNINLKGVTARQEREFLETLSVESKRSKWRSRGYSRKGEAYALTVEDIMSFYKTDEEELESMLSRLTRLGYLRQDTENTYRISSGKLTFPVSHVLRKDGYSNTIVATDCDRLTVVDNGKLRRFTETEMRRLFGFPDSFRFPEGLTFKQKCDLFGNSVVVQVAEAATKNLYSRLKTSSYQPEL